MNVQFFRFLLVGVLNTVVGYGIFAVLVWLGLDYAIAIGLATMAGIAFNFFSTGRLVFGSARTSHLARFIVIYAVIYVLNVLGLKLLLGFGLNVYAANALLILPLATLSFLLLRKFVYSNP